MSASEPRFFKPRIHTMQQQLATITPRIGSRDLREGVLVSGKYRIEKLIARGGMGLVYRASQPMIARRVALKVVRPELLSHPDAADKLINEACVLGQFQNDHVCRILDAGRLEDGAPYLVLEYLDGTDLRVLLNREKRIEPRRAVDWMMGLLEALAEAHALGIVHRDVKPENLVLAQTPSGESVKLLDFGICFAPHVPGADERRVSEDYGVGSPHYMAPEQISSPDSSDHRIDIWSVGVVLFELLSGEAPFEGDSAMSICAQVLAREPVALTQLVPTFASRPGADRGALHVQGTRKALRGRRRTRRGARALRHRRRKRSTPAYSSHSELSASSAREEEEIELTEPTAPSSIGPASRRARSALREDFGGRHGRRARYPGRRGGPEPCGAPIEPAQKGAVMIDIAQIQPHMAVVCSNERQFAVVDHMEGTNAIKLAKDRSGRHHYIPLSWVTSVDDKVHVDRPGDRSHARLEQFPAQLSLRGPRNRGPEGVKRRISCGLNLARLLVLSAPPGQLSSVVEQRFRKP